MKRLRNRAHASAIAWVVLLAGSSFPPAFATNLRLTTNAGICDVTLAREGGQGPGVITMERDGQVQRITFTPVAFNGPGCTALRPSGSHVQQPSWTQAPTLNGYSDLTMPPAGGQAQLIWSAQGAASCVLSIVEHDDAENGPSEGIVLASAHELPPSGAHWISVPANRSGVARRYAVALRCRSLHGGEVQGGLWITVRP